MSDEDDTDKLLDMWGKKIGDTGKVCRQWFTNKAGKRQRCTKKKGHWGKHG